MEPIERIVGSAGKTSKPGGEGGTPGVVSSDGQTSKPGGEGGTPGFVDASESLDETAKDS
jgi:hypothetical protein